MESLKVEEYMNSNPVTLTVDMAIEEASAQFIRSKQTGAPVIDANRQLVGFLSENDVLAKMLESIYHNHHAYNVADVMRKEVLSVKPYDSIIELGQSMLGNRPKIYPVVDDDGNLLGAISRNDVLFAIDRHMHESFKKQ